MGIEFYEGRRQSFDRGRQGRQRYQRSSAEIGQLLLPPLVEIDLVVSTLNG